MLDIQFIRDNAELVQKAATNKNVDVDVKQLLKLDSERSSLHGQVDELRQQRNQLAGAAKGKQPDEADVKKGRELKDKLGKLESELNKADAVFSELLAKVPNVPSDDTPVGKDEAANKVIRAWSKPAKFDFKPKEHWQLGEELGLIDLEKAAKVAGSRFFYLKGNLVRLQFALSQFVLNTLTNPEILKEIIAKNKLDVPATPFVPVLPPGMVRAEVFAKTGRKDPVEDKYYLKEDDLFLIGSAEHSLAPYHMNDVLNEKNLPLRYVGYSTNFRREAGSYGKDVRGILRNHQFDKWEMFSLTTAETGEAEQNFIVAMQEYLMQQLELPYQVVAISTGDMGKPDYRQIDIETWLPGQGKYRETQTSDWNTDFQARRLNIKYVDKSGNKKFVHTNDATAFSQRPLIAILENYQTLAGKVKVPKILQGYMGGEWL